MKPAIDPFKPTCPLWQAVAAEKSRDRQELAALPPAEAQSRVSHRLPVGAVQARVTEIDGDGRRDPLGLAGILAWDR